MIGEWHEAENYRFRETLHGPMVWGTCVDCRQRALEVQPTGRIGHGGQEEDTGGAAATRCSRCGRVAHDAGIDYYGTGRTELYGDITIDRRKLYPNQGGSTTMAAFFWRALHPDDPRTQCSLCSLPVDPAARTVEHPDRHPSCATYWEDAPMETPLGPEG